MRLETRLLTPEAAVSAVLGTPAAASARQMARCIYRREEIRSVLHLHFEKNF